MDKLLVHGGQPLQGQIRISGAKNSALKLMAASLLTEEPLHLNNQIDNYVTIKQMKGPEYLDPIERAMQEARKGGNRR